MLSRLFWREHRSSRGGDGAQHDTTTTAAQSARAGTSQQPATTAVATAVAVVSTQAATATRASKHAHAVTAACIDVISTQQQQQQRQRQRRVPLVQLRPLTLVRVPSYRVRSNYVEYAVLCSEAHTAWRVHRRYQQFKDLDRALRQLCSKATTTTTTNAQPHSVAAHATAAASNTDNNNSSSHRCSCHGALPVLPSSHWMEVTNQSVERVERRRRLLEVYLQQLLVPANHFYLLHSPLYRFLHEGKVTVPHTRHNNNNKDGGQTAATTMNGDEDDGMGIAPLPGLSMHASCSDNDDDDDTMSKAHSGTDDKQTRCGSVQTTVTATTTTTTTTAAVAQHVNVQVSPSPPPMLARDAVTAASSSSPPSTTTTSHEKAQSSSGDDDDETDARRRATLPLHMTSAQAAPRALRYAASVHSAASTPHHHRCCCCSADDVTAAAAAGAAGGAVATAPRVSSTMWSEVAGAATTRTTTTSMSDVGTATTSTATMTMPPQTPQEQQLCEERLPACGVTCTQCAAEYTSMRRPHRCYLCRCCVCSRCLTRVALSPCTSHIPTATAAAATDVHKGDECDGAGVWRRRCCTVVRVCAQCAENCRRRRERAEAAAHDVLPMSSSSSSSGGGGGDDGGGRAASSDRASSSASSSLSSSQYAHRRLSTTQAGVNEAAAAAAAADDENTIEARNNNNNSSAATCQQQLPRVSVHSFVLLTVLGQGTFGKVLKVRHRDSGVVYAMKVLSKAAVRRRGVATYVCEERHIFAALPPHPYVVRCHFAFQSRCHVFFVLDYVAGGELYRRLYPRRVLSRREAQLYAAEVVLAVQHLHAHDIAHRDVKPENVLLDGEGHIRLVDFGLARRHLSRTRRRSFVGSAEYVAPETIAGATQTVAVDWWGVGVLLYEMLVGQTPFRAASNAAVYERVLHDDVEALLASHDTLDAAAVSLLRGLLQRDVAARMRVAASLCEHAFFDGVDWQALRQRRVAAVAHVPELRFCDVRYFRRRYTAQWARLPTLPHAAAATAPHAPRDSFDGFDYVTSSSSSDEDDGGGACHDAEQHKNKTTAVCDTTRTCDAHVSPSPLLRACSRAVLCGAWRAVAVEVRAVDGRVTYPWGGDVTGQLQHTPCTQHDADDTGDGVVLYYSMQLSASPSARPPPTVVRADALDDAAQADVCDVLSSYVASCGTCVLHVDSQCVVYTPHTHLMPGECGRPLRLGYELETTTMHGAEDDNSSSSSRGRGGNTPSPLHVLRLYTPVQRVAVDEGDADGEADVHAVTVTTWVKLEDA